MTEFFASVQLPKRMGMAKQMGQIARSYAQGGHSVLIARVLKPDIIVHLVDGKVCWTKIPKPPARAVIIDDIPAWEVIDEVCHVVR
jgi:hypothetical protein